MTRQNGRLTNLIGLRYFWARICDEDDDAIRWRNKTGTLFRCILPYCHGRRSVDGGCEDEEEEAANGEKGHSTGNREFITFRRPFIKFMGSERNSAEKF